MADRRIWADLGLTGLLAVVALAGTGPAAANQGMTAPPAAVALAVAAALPVAIRRWRPLWAFAATGTATAIYFASGYAYGPVLFPLVIACYSVAVRSPARRAVVAAAALAAATAVAMLIGGRTWTAAAEVAAWIAVPAAIGVAVKVRRDAAARVRAEQGRRAVSDERLQLAQEVHDVVGHGLAVIAMQSGVALRVLDRDPAQARAALEAIRATSTEALDGLRAEVEALRRGPHVPLRPSTGLADLPALAERIRASGLPVTVEASLDPAGLPAGVDLAAYRIVQESLTNVLRHAGPEATARVRIERDGDAVRIAVHDTGRGSAGPVPAGHGVDGMRARAAALGGHLDTGPLPGGGFAVEARLPIVDEA